MAMPRDIAAIDLQMNVPTSEHNSEGYSVFAPLLRDRESRESYTMPAQHLFKDVPNLGKEKGDYVHAMVREMDRFNIEKGLIGVSDRFEHFDLVKGQYADRFILGTQVDPNGGVDEIRRVKRLVGEHGIKAVTFFPAGSYPQVPINGKELYPIYAMCCELDLPILINCGVPGPRLPMATQKVELIDEVCWFFPELKFIMRHGAEPWVDLAVKLMLKYPNLYYCTSAFAPKYYPKAIVDFANTRGADKIMYAGYFPAGLSLERIFRELEAVPFKDEVWPKFLRGNAARVFGLE